ncbi:MAG: CDP-glucose 4,6-dehydratase [Bacteroidales bacterium]|nr:CDP-glucose 4,6-dehydratase [Bacteroidales bacterium]MCM1414504.1 CDP-glucose 4,6-dehydratase [bacterium]MCM1422556.1 CDP-glucose 4,6-dehydratase [bacterium]
MNFGLDFYKGKKVLITGHTGFKGTWMCMLLAQAGAQVTGYALKPPAGPSVFALSGIADKIDSVTGDIRDLAHLQQVFAETQPEIVIHMAAQPIVRESYRDPVYTYEVNVMGTVNILECVRTNPCVRSFVNVTTDKVYRNREWEWGYRENEELNGYDPYSNSKSCSELVTSSYKNSFLNPADCGKDQNVRPAAVSTARAGNVIGGGDFAADRIIPDCVRAVLADQEIVVRNPYSTRPYQHVLEPVAVYLMLAARQWEDPAYAGSYNVGPDETDCYTTGEIVTLFCEKWNRATGQQAVWRDEYDGGPHEANFLKLDCAKLKSVFGWKPVWNVEQAMEKIVEWTIAYRDGGDIAAVMNRQIEEFLRGRE